MLFHFQQILSYIIIKDVFIGSHCLGLPRGNLKLTLAFLPGIIFVEKQVHWKTASPHEKHFEMPVHPL